MPQTVTLVLYDPAHAADLDYRLHGEQAQYSVSPQERLQNGRFAAPDCLAVTILCQNRPIGFFILDKGSDRLTYSTNPRAVLLRSMSVNPAYQGKAAPARRWLTIIGAAHPQHIARLRRNRVRRTPRQPRRHRPVPKLRICRYGANLYGHKGAAIYLQQNDSVKGRLKQ